MLMLAQIVDRIGACGVISKFDLTKGYYQVRMKEEDQPKTAFCSPYGKFQFTRVPFGLKNATALFQRFMERVLLSCRGYADAYIDEIVVYSMNRKEHMGHINRVLEEVKKVGMTARPRKCCWGRRHIVYLGHIVGDGRLAVPEDRVVTMKEYIRPVKKKELRSFLGGICYYRMFIENFANSSAVLSPATAKATPDPIQ